MTTEIGQEVIFAVIAFLERNDFTMIRQISPHTLRARDGDTSVFLWIDDHPGPLPGIPCALFDMVRDASARLDLVRIIATEGKADIKHIMNVEVM